MGLVFLGIAAGVVSFLLAAFFSVPLWICFLAYCAVGLTAISVASFILMGRIPREPLAIQGEDLCRTSEYYSPEAYATVNLDVVYSLSSERLPGAHIKPEIRMVGKAK